MNDSLPEAAARVLLCVTGALIAVLLLRLPLRQAFGPRIAYTIWLLVPVTAVGVMVGAIIPVNPLASTVLPAQLLDISPSWSALPGTPVLSGQTHWVVLGWMIGAGLFALLLWWQQHAFVHRLGVLQPTPTGAWMAEVDDIGPVVVGVFPPRMVLPADFYQRYTTQEQVLVLAHETMHITRRDHIANLVTAVVRAGLWFHPLIHLAIRYFRIDQEFACDAAVLQVHPRDRYHYAYALLRGQTSGPVLPAGCHLDSHAATLLKRRIAMLQTPSPSRGRRVLGGIAVALSVIAGGSVVTFLAACAEEGTSPDRSAEEMQPAASANAVGSPTEGLTLALRGMNGVKIESAPGNDAVIRGVNDEIIVPVKGVMLETGTNEDITSGAAEGVTLPAGVLQFKVGSNDIVGGAVEGVNVPLLNVNFAIDTDQIIDS